jgi:IS4 transposase
LIITTDLNQKLLAFKIIKGSTDDRKVFIDLNKNLTGVFVADAGYIGEKLRNEFNNKFRFLLTAVKKNMRKLETEWQHAIYNTRMKIEINFRSLKLFYKLETSLPRSVDGYIANYVYSILAYCLR